MIVYVVSGTCGDYYCGCGLGHLVGIAMTEDEADRLKDEGEAATHHYKSHGTTSVEFKSFRDVTIDTVPVGVLLNEAVR